MGKYAGDFVSGRRKLKLQVCVSSDGPSTTSTTARKRSDTGAFGSDYPPPTNVSSPVQAVSRSRVAPRSKVAASHHGYIEDDDFVVDDEGQEALAELHTRHGRHSRDASDESDDGFEPVREAGQVRRSTRRDIGPPITIDEKLERLNPIHRFVVDDFLLEAQKESDKASVFSDAAKPSHCPSDHTQIVMFKQLRAQPFSTTILREMAINFPKGRFLRSDWVVTH